MLGSTDEITVSIGPFFSLSFPFLSRSELPAGCCCLLGVCNNPEPFRPLSFPPLFITLATTLLQSFRINSGQFRAKKSSRGKILLLCNIIRSHDVMMGRTFNFVYALSTTDGRQSYRVLSEGTAKDKIRTKKRETSVSRRGKSLTNQVIGTLQKPWFICLTVNL